LFDDDDWANDLLNLTAEKPIEQSHQKAAQRIFEGRQSYSVAGNIRIRLAQHKLFNALMGASHPMDQAAGRQMEVRTKMERESTLS
jgi:hypothetical protein